MPRPRESSTVLGVRVMRSAAMVLALALSSRVQGQEAARAGDEHAARGQKFFAAGNYAQAIDELRAGFIVTNQPRFLYALGQAYRMNHQCVEAVQAYRDFVSAKPSREQTADAEERIRLCGAEDPASVATPAVVTPPAPTLPQTAPPAIPIVARPVPAPTPTDVVAAHIEEHPAMKPSKPIYKRWWVWTTVGVVAVGLGVGVGVGLTRSSFSPTEPPFGPGRTSHHPR